MKIIIGTRKEQIEISGVCWVMTDTCALHIHADGDRAVIEEEVEDHDEN